MDKENKYTIKKMTDFITIPPDMDVWGYDVSDGHHTMNELYNHRHALFCALLKIYDNYITPLQSRVKCWKSKCHADGTMYPGWFIAGMLVTNVQGTPTQISYHLPLDYWKRVNTMEFDRAPDWDGHTSDMVIQRLLEL